MEKCSVEFQIIDVETINCFLEALMVGRTPVVIRMASLACALAQAVHQGRNNTRAWCCFRRGSHLTFHWHSIRGPLLHISACAALIVQCDETEIVHYVDCVGLHYHQLHFPLFDPKLHLNASEIWRTTFNQMYKLNLVDSSRSVCLSYAPSLHRYTARQRWLTAKNKLQYQFVPVHVMIISETLELGFYFHSLRYRPTVRQGFHFV